MARIVLADGRKIAVRPSTHLPVLRIRTAAGPPSSACRPSSARLDGHHSRSIALSSGEGAPGGKADAALRPPPRPHGHTRTDRGEQLLGAYGLHFDEPQLRRLPVP